MRSARIIQPSLPGGQPVREVLVSVRAGPCLSKRVALPRIWLCGMTNSACSREAASSCMARVRFWPRRCRAASRSSAMPAARAVEVASSRVRAGARSSRAPWANDHVAAEGGCEAQTGERGGGGDDGFVRASPPEAGTMLFRIPRTRRCRSSGDQSSAAKSVSLARAGCRSQGRRRTGHRREGMNGKRASVWNFGEKAFCLPWHAARRADPFWFVGLGVDRALQGRHSGFPSADRRADLRTGMCRTAPCGAWEGRNPSPRKASPAAHAEAGPMPCSLRVGGPAPSAGWELQRRIGGGIKRSRHRGLGAAVLGLPRRCRRTPGSPGMTWLSSAQAPKSMRRQRSEQKGRKGLAGVHLTGFEQVGQTTMRGVSSAIGKLQIAGVESLDGRIEVG